MDIPDNSSSSKVDVSKIETLYLHYKGKLSFPLNLSEPDEDYIGFSGMEKISKDIGIEADSIDPFVFVWQLGATSVMQISKEEFVEGLTALK